MMGLEHAGPLPLAAAMRELAVEMLTLAAGRARAAGEVRFAGQITAELAEVRARLFCVHCQGDLDRPDWYLTAGEGRCTCLATCPQQWCLAAGGEP